KAYTGGYTVITTLNSKRQADAVYALRKDLLAYDARHKWHGPEDHLDDDIVDDKQALKEALDKMVTRAGLIPAVVLSTSGQNMRLATSQYGEITIGYKQIPWLGKKDKASALAGPGDVVRLQDISPKEDSQQWR